MWSGSWRWPPSWLSRAAHPRACDEFGCTILFVATNFYDPMEHVVLHARSFYAAYKVAELPGGKFRVLYHGTTAHGAEKIRDDTGKPLVGRPGDG